MSFGLRPEKMGQEGKADLGATKILEFELYEADINGLVQFLENKIDIVLLQNNCGSFLYPMKFVCHNDKKICYN